MTRLAAVPHQVTLFRCENERNRPWLLHKIKKKTAADSLRLIYAARHSSTPFDLSAVFIGGGVVRRLLANRNLLERKPVARRDASSSKPFVISFSRKKRRIGSPPAPCESRGETKKKNVCGSRAYLASSRPSLTLLRHRFHRIFGVRDRWAHEINIHGGRAARERTASFGFARSRTSHAKRTVFFFFRFAEKNSPRPDTS